VFVSNEGINPETVNRLSIDNIWNLIMQLMNIFTARKLKKINLHIISKPISY